MTNLTDALASPPSAQKCAFGRWVKSLPENEQEAVSKALVNPEWSATKLTAVLKSFGMTSSRETVGVHKNGRCTVCGPV